MSPGANHVLGCVVALGLDQAAVIQRRQDAVLPHFTHNPRLSTAGRSHRHSHNALSRSSSATVGRGYGST